MSPRESPYLSLATGIVRHAHPSLLLPLCFIKTVSPKGQTFIMLADS